MTEVSVRELKSNLAAYIRRAEAGEEISVTRRGKRVVEIRALGGGESDTPKTVDEKIRDLMAQGKIKWNGKPFKPPAKRARLIGEGPTISEMIIEDRR